MRSRRIGKSFPSAIIACLRTGRAPTGDELRSVADRIEEEAGLRDRFSKNPDQRVRAILRAALQATGMVELSAKERSMP